MISPILTVIEHQYQAKIKKANHKLYLHIIAVGVMTLLFLVLLMYVNPQIIDDSNERLWPNQSVTLMIPLRRA